MRFDFPTLFAIVIFVSLVAGFLLVFSWRQNPNIPSLGMWGTAYIVMAAGMTAVYVRSSIPEDLSILVANPLICFAHGLMWGAARRFEGRHTPPLLVSAGAIIWVGACFVEGFYASYTSRMILTAGISGIYLVLCAAEIWRGHDRALKSRKPTVVLLLVHASVYLSRIPLWSTLPSPYNINVMPPDYVPYGVFEILLHTICMAVLLVNMAKERAELSYREASLVDSLTGVANRRAFFDGGEQLLRGARAGAGPLALILFDLDRFKQINDTFGHQTGDRVLKVFCEAAALNLPPGAVLGRLGGEEFGCLLADTSMTDASDIADSIRTAFEVAAVSSGAAPTIVTVSAGVALSSDAGWDMTRLFAAADRALYRAKSNGRNTVETSRPSLVVIENAPSLSPAG